MCALKTRLKTPRKLLLFAVVHVPLAQLSLAAFASPKCAVFIVELAGHNVFDVLCMFVAVQYQKLLRRAAKAVRGFVVQKLTRKIKQFREEHSVPEDASELPEQLQQMVDELQRVKVF
jgi:hypothetical protein